MTSGSGQGPELRIADADREAAVSALGEHYVAGRLTRDEYDERAAAAWAARTASTLWPLFADLPRPGSGRPDASLRLDAPAAPRPATTSWHRSHLPDWRPSSGLGWVMVVLAAFMVLTHLPVFAFVAVVWLLVSRSGTWGRPAGRSSAWPPLHR